MSSESEESQPQSPRIKNKITALERKEEKELKRKNILL